MATLADLLALLPDNDTGAIDAADLRTIVTELFNRIAALEEIAPLEANQITSMGAKIMDNAARISALEESGGGGGGGVTVTGRWQVNPTPGATPQGKQMTFETDTFPAANWIRFDPSDQNNNDLTTALLNADSIFMQHQTSSDVWARWNVTGAATDHDSYVEVPVDFIVGDGGAAGAEWQAAVVVLQVTP